MGEALQQFGIAMKRLDDGDAEQERTLRPTGIHLFGLRYWSAALSADVGR